MVRGPGSGFHAGLILAFALFLTTSCAPGVTAVRPAEEAPPSPETRQPTDSPRTTAVTTTTTTTLATTSISRPSTTTLPTTASSSSEVHFLSPSGPGPFPTVVLLHGGGWVAGSPDLMTGLADFLVAEGYMVVNAAYRLSGSEPGFPRAVHDAACAVRHAKSHPDGDGTVTVIGHSAGAHIGALVSLDDGDYGVGCSVETAADVDRMIGLAGPYQVTRLGPLLLPFFGSPPEEDPEAWREGDPFDHVDENPELEILLLYGENDSLVAPSFALDFAAALLAAGKPVTTLAIAGARHSDMDHPDFVGPAILDWLEAP